MAAIAAGILAPVWRRWRYGVLAVGTALLAGAVATGAGVLSILAIALVWAFAGALAAGTRR